METMTRYTATLEHIPGYGQRDHLFDVFVCAIENRLAPEGYADKDDLRQSMRRIAREAREVSQFDGNYRWQISAIA